MADYLDYDGLALYDEKIKQLIGGKQDAESGKGLSTNDYTTTEKNKLAGIASGAEVNVQSDWNQATSTADDFIKNKPTLGTAAAKTAGAAAGNVPLVGTALGTTANKILVTTAAGALAPSSYTVGAASAKGVASSVSSGGSDLPTSGAVYTAIQDAIGSITGISFNTDYTTVASLPQTGTAGVIYLIPNSGSNPNSYDEYVWTGSAYERLGTTDVDLSGYQPLMSAITNSQINGLFS